MGDGSDGAEDGASALADAPIGSSMVAGAFAAIVSRICTHPTDTVKARLQMQGALGAAPVYRGTTHAFTSLARAEGLPGFYRGFGAILLGFAPAQATYFGAYEAGKAVTQPLRAAGHGVVADMATGLLQQTAAGILFTPIDIIKERLQVQTMMKDSYNYRSTWHAISSIIAQRGLRGMLKGYWAGNSVWFPWNAIYIASYEHAKKAASRRTDAAELPAWALALCSAGSATLACTVTHPVDVCKTQLQVLSATEAGGSLTAVQVFRNVLRTHGARGFAAGLTPRLLTIVPGNMIAWLTYEKVKQVLA